MIFRNYEYFLAIVRAGSLTRATEQLYVSQPSLSQYVRRLEASLGVELFDHSTSPLRLTYAGERYYQYLLQLHALSENVRREFQDIQDQEGGQLRLGVALWRGACLLPDVFPSFHARYPGIRLELTEDRAEVLLAGLHSSRLDLAVLNLPTPLKDPNLAAETIFPERILLAAPAGHPYVRELLAGQAPEGDYPHTTLEMLRHFPLISTKSGQGLTYAVSQALAQAQITPDLLMETANLTTAINLAAAGMACTFVPEEGAKVCQHPGQLAYFAVDAPGFQWDLAAVYRKDTHLLHIARLFMDALKQQWQPEAASGL